MKKLVSILVLFALFTSNAHAQFGETIRSGRPGQAIGPFTVGARVLQFQAGVDYAAYKIDRPFNETMGRTIGSDLVIRYGITERFEMGLGLVYKNETTTLSNFFEESSSTIEGISAFSVRVRSNIYEGKGLIPSVGFQFSMSLPAVSKVYRPMQVAPKITAMTNQRFGKRVGLTTNWGAVWDGKSEIPEGFYVINIGVDLTDFMSTFVELYANFGKDHWNGSVDGGFAFLVTPNLQLDVLGGYGPFNVRDDWFVSTGISWRIRFNKKEKKEKS